jgi:hypothetical protein
LEVLSALSMLVGLRHLRPQRFGVPQKLFDSRASTLLVQGNLWMYGATPDGQRFLVNALTETDAPTVNVFTNWQQSVD